MISWPCMTCQLQYIKFHWHYIFLKKKLVCTETCTTSHIKLQYCVQYPSTHFNSWNQTYSSEVSGKISDLNHWWVYLCVGGTSWIWPLCCCPSWVSPWRRLRSTLHCPSTPLSSASWEYWGLHEVWTSNPPPPPTHPSILTSLCLLPLWQTDMYTVWSHSWCCTFRKSHKTATSPGLPYLSFLHGRTQQGSSRVWTDQMARKNMVKHNAEKEKREKSAET